MNGQATRRMLCAALVVMASAAAALGTAHSASAKDAQKIPDYSSKEGFKGICESIDGTFIEDGLGNTECHYPDGSWTECDANGQDCWYTPGSIPAPPPGIQLPPIDGTIISAPIVDGTTQHGNSGDAATVAGDQESAKTKHSNRQKGKQRGHGGKGRKK